MGYIKELADKIDDARRNRMWGVVWYQIKPFHL
jgi:hypothetical protein